MRSVVDLPSTYALSAANLKAVGTPVLFHIGTVDGNPDAPFWERARSVSVEIERFKAPQIAREALDQITAAVAEGRTPVELLQMLVRQQIQYRLLVSNLGELKLQARYRTLNVASVILGVARAYHPFKRSPWGRCVARWA